MLELHKASERRSDELLLAVAVDVAGRQEAAEPIADLGDHDPLLRVRVGVVAPDLDALLERVRGRVHVALDDHVELVATVAVDVVDEHLLRVAIAEIGDDDAPLAGLRDVADDVAGLRRAVEPVRLGGRRVHLEHAAILADLDGDGKDELYVASDKHNEVRRYAWDGQKLARQVIYKRGPTGGVFTWNLMPIPASLVPAD